MVSKKRKGAASAEWQRKKKQLKAEAAEAVNPFELRFTRKKHDVLGQRIKGQTGSRGKARDAAIQKRKKTLLVEMNNKSRTGLFVDKRFGEYDETMSAEERMLQRFQHERMNRHERSGAFNLPDPEESLTHGGQSLGQMLDDYVPSDDDEDAGEEGNLLGAENTGRINFGGFEPKGPISEGDEVADPDRPRTRKEIMEEVMMKAKKYKMERQQTALETSNKIEELDDQFDDSFKMLLGQASIRAEEKQEAAPRKPQDGYDRLVRELTFEARGRATDRMKTPEEIARAERDKLEKLEAERIQRMTDKSTKAPVVDAETSVEYLENERKAKAGPVELQYVGDGKYQLVGGDGKKSGAQSAADDDWAELDAGEAPVSKSKTDESDSSEDDGEDVESDSDDSSDDEGEEGAATNGDLKEADDMQVDDVKDDSEKPLPVKSSAGSAAGRGRVVQDSASSADLPYTFEMPPDPVALWKLLGSHSIENKLTIVSRIVTCHDVRLAAANRAKMESFFRTVLVGSLDEASRDPSKLLPMVDALLGGPIFDITQQVPEAAVDCVLSELDAVEKVASKKKYMFVNLRELLLLQVVRNLFPVSDFRHRVVTPAFLLLGAALSAKTIRSAEDVVSGLACAALALEYATPAKRLFPEAIMFLTDILTVLTNCGSCSWATVAEELTERTFGLHEVLAATPTNIKLSWMDAYPLRPIDPQYWASVACRTCEVLLGFARLYSELESFSALFAGATDAARLLQDDSSIDGDSEVASVAKAFVDEVESKSGRILTPLRLQQHRPVPLRTFEPDYDDGYRGRKIDPDKERRETRKLKALHKKELKGAIRELRQDAKFMAKVKLDKRREFDEERSAVVKAYENELAQDLGQHRVVEKMKQKKKGKLK